jgi:23S rRNA (uracil1939-C5)-methyltransferase
LRNDVSRQTLRIEKLVYGGDGLARSDAGVVLVPFVLPGELIHADVARAKNDLRRAAVVEIAEPAPARVAALCPYFTRCGGCQYQHAPYEFQVETKLSILREVLRRTGKIEFESDIPAVTGEPWHYRNRTQLHVERGEIGYFEASSHRLCAIDQCPISSPKLNEAIAALSRELPRHKHFNARLELFTNETDIQVHILDPVPFAARSLFDALGPTGAIEYGEFRVSRNSFFQVNRFLAERLVETVLGDATGETALDLYAGVGLFSLALARRFRSVTAVESGVSAHRDLEFNATRAGVKIDAQRANAEDYLASLANPPDLLVLDPPRSGLGRQIVGELVRLKARETVIVSCDPSTLARDLRPLLDAGYKIESITLVDLFPQTYHLETVTRLSRGAG